MPETPEIIEVRITNSNYETVAFTPKGLAECEQYLRVMRLIHDLKKLGVW